MLRTLYCVTEIIFLTNVQFFIPHVNYVANYILKKKSV